MSEISLSKAGLSPPPADERENLLASLGPGLITGAADDDPSGIATYLLVGAQFGFAMLWTMLFSFPLMAGIQEICGRLGRITGMGVAANLAKCYPKTVVRGLVLLLTLRISLILARMLPPWQRRCNCLLGAKAALVCDLFRSGFPLVAGLRPVPYLRSVSQMVDLGLVCLCSNCVRRARPLGAGAALHVGPLCFPRSQVSDGVDRRAGHHD
jgi:hypothetical protein